MSCSRMYWDREMRYDKVADVMSRRRFETTKKNLHVVDNEKRPENCSDKLFKTGPLADALNANFSKMVPGEHLSCDEQIVPFKDGLINNFEIYDGAIQTCPGQPDTMSSGNIVLRLLQNIPRNVGHKIYCDNWFTARLNRLSSCNVPNDKELKKKGRGASVIHTTLFNDVEVRAIKWYDNRGVILVSTYAGIAPLGKISRYDRVTKKRIDVDCPDVVKLYNKCMGGVDLLDMLIALYRNPVRSKKWYHRMIFHLLDTIVVQAWNTYRRDARLSGIPDPRKIIKLQTFKYQIALCLTRENKVPTKRGRPSIDVDELQRAKVSKGGGGAATKIPPKPIRNDKFGHWPIVTTRGRCRFPSCKAAPVIKCTKCDAHLCLNSTSNCFMKFHGV
ncbi:piggyBac transposable element-derived protein 3-like [Hydra vulgaris]|uniref:PiggyBac transposable element-derived protein 3-like n=1 Tax=Hydra vulgaris TaxID=6087 RepID=A0ABM4DBV5_HYDVU